MVKPAILLFSSFQCFSSFTGKTCWIILFVSITVLYRIYCTVPLNFFLVPLSRSHILSIFRSLNSISFEHQHALMVGQPDRCSLPLSLPPSLPPAFIFTAMLIFLPLLLLLPGTVCRAGDIPEDATAEFSVRLYHQLQAASGEDNIIFSPLSVAVALGMVELGARGSSLREIRQAVGFSHLPTGESARTHTHTCTLKSKSTAHKYPYKLNIHMLIG